MAKYTREEILDRMDDMRAEDSFKKRHPLFVATFPKGFHGTTHCRAINEHGDHCKLKLDHEGRHVGGMGVEPWED